MEHLVAPLQFKGVYAWMRACQCATSHCAIPIQGSSCLAAQHTSQCIIQRHDVISYTYNIAKLRYKQIVAKSTQRRVQARCTPGSAYGARIRLRANVGQVGEQRRSQNNGRSRLPLPGPPNSINGLLDRWNPWQHACVKHIQVA
jgi:hypothetical protein